MQIDTHKISLLKAKPSALATASATVAQKANFVKPLLANGKMEDNQYLMNLNQQRKLGNKINDSY